MNIPGIPNNQLQLSNPNDPTIPFEESQLTDIEMFQVWSIPLVSFVKATNQYVNAGRTDDRRLNADELTGDLWTCRTKKVGENTLRKQLHRLQNEERKTRAEQLANVMEYAQEHDIDPFTLIPPPVHSHVGENSLPFSG